jgi:hypothetical protein
LEDVMIVNAASATHATTPMVKVDPLDGAIRHFERTGQVEADAFAEVNQPALHHALSNLSPAVRVALERELQGNGLGGLLGGVVAGATGTVAEVADAAVETPSEHQAEEMGTAWQVQSLDRLRAQGHLDAALFSYGVMAREAAPHASNVAIRPNRDEASNGAGEAGRSGE